MTKFEKYNKIIEEMEKHEKNCGASDIYYCCNEILKDAITDLKEGLNNLISEAFEYKCKDSIDFYNEMLNKLNAI